MWYIIQVKSNAEYIFVRELEQIIEKLHLQTNIQEIIVPTVKHEDNIEQKFCHGYVVIKCMELTAEVQNAIRSLTRFIRFLGYDSNTPHAHSDTEIANVIAIKPQDLKKQFCIGQSVRIKQGSFQSMCGTIENINDEKHRLTVEVPVFGRLTKVDLDFSHVEHV